MTTRPDPRQVEQWGAEALALGCPREQVDNFMSVGYAPQTKQMLFHVAARACDAVGGPDQIGFGGARGPGKSHGSFAQVALDDCRRVPGLKALYLRKVGKQAREQFEDLRRSVLSSVPHVYDKRTGTVTLWGDSRIVLGHFRSEQDVDNYLGIEYDVILIEEATTLTETKYRALRDSNRTGKRGWRPRVYTTTNPGNIGHAWYKRRFVEPHRLGEEIDTRFIPATVEDNRVIDVGYRKKLMENVGWKRRAYLLGDWDIAAGQYFTAFDADVHVTRQVYADEKPYRGRIVWWWLAMDYGFTHPTVFVLLGEDGDGGVHVVDEHVQAGWLPERHARAVRAMLRRHGAPDSALWEVAAGVDVFNRTGERTIAEQYQDEGIQLIPADTDRINGAAEVSRRLGDPAAGVAPSIIIFARCHRLIACLPILQHDPRRPEDVLKIDVDEDGYGGDDPYDALRYGLMAAGRHEVSGTSAAPLDPIAEADRAGGY